MEDDVLGSWFSSIMLWATRALLVAVLATLMIYPVSLLLEKPFLSLLAYLPEVMIWTTLGALVVLGWWAQWQLERNLALVGLIFYGVLYCCCVPSTGTLAHRPSWTVWSWNCRSWLNDPEQLIPWLLEQKWDVVCLQEAQHQDLIPMLRREEAPLYWKRGREDRFHEKDLMVISRYPIVENKVVSLGQSWGQAVTILRDDTTLGILHTRLDKWPLQQQANREELINLPERQRDEIVLAREYAETHGLDMVLGDWNCGPLSLGAQALFEQNVALYGGADYPENFPMYALSWGAYLGEAELHSEILPGQGSDHRVLAVQIGGKSETRD